MPVVCGVDLGTQGCKALLYDSETMRILARTRVPLALRSGEGGVREQEAAWYRKALFSCLVGFDPALRKNIRAVGVSGQQHGFVPMDGEGQVIRSVKLWCDTSAAAECEELTARAGGAEQVRDLTGMPFLPGYTAPKILWMKNREPEAFGRLAQVLLPHDYLNYLLTGEYSAEAGDASGTALFDVRSRRWSRQACELIDERLYACLPPLRQPWEASGRVSPQAAREFGLPAGAYVSAGGGDNMMGALGTGTLRQGFLALSLGTSGTLYGHAEHPLVDPEDRLASFCSSSGAWLPLLCTMNCTVAVEEVRGLLDLGLEEFNRLAEKAPVGAEGIVLLPYFNGERVPNLPYGRASVQGVRAGSLTRENLARAAMESAVFGFRLGLEAFVSLGYSPKEIRLTGGGAKSGLWRRMIADGLGLSLSLPVEEESAAFGAALQALYCLMAQEGGAPDIAALADLHVGIDTEARVEPDDEKAQEWEGAYLRYREYLGALAPLYRPGPHAEPRT